MFARVCTRSKFTRSVVKLVEHTRTHGWVVHESSNEEWRLRTCFAGIPRAASTSFCHRPRLDCKLGLHRSCPHTAMSGLRITNEITNLDGPGPPVVQTDFAPQGHTELLATGSATALARVRPGQRASVRYALNPPGAPPAAAPAAAADAEPPADAEPEPELDVAAVMAQVAALEAEGKFTEASEELRKLVT